MPDTAFEELTVQRVNDVEWSGAQISFSQSADHTVHEIQRIVKGLHGDALVAPVCADIVIIDEDAAGSIRGDTSDSQILAVRCASLHHGQDGSSRPGRRGGRGDS